MKKTWQGINELLNHCKRKGKSVGKLKDPDDKNNLTNDSLRIPNILNKHFSNVGNILARKLPPAERPFTEYLRKSSSPELSFFFQTCNSIRNSISNFAYTKQQIAWLILLSDSTS